MCVCVIVRCVRDSQRQWRKESSIKTIICKLSGIARAQSQQNTQRARAPIQSFIWIIWIKIQSNKIFFCVIEGTFFHCRLHFLFVCLFDFFELVKVVAHKISLSKRTELQIIATKYLINTKHVNHFEEIMKKKRFESREYGEKVNKITVMSYKMSDKRKNVMSWVRCNVHFTLKHKKIQMKNDDALLIFLTLLSLVMLCAVRHPFQVKLVIGVKNLNIKEMIIVTFLLLVYFFSIFLNCLIFMWMMVCVCLCVGGRSSVKCAAKDTSHTPQWRWW